MGHAEFIQRALGPTRARQRLVFRWRAHLFLEHHMWIEVDFETASMCDLKAAGADRYAEDASTEVLCLSWELAGGKQGHWVPDDGMAVPEDIAYAIAHGYMFVAHSARFERAVWRCIMARLYGWPDIPIEKWHDTMARCAELVLPMKLEMVARVLGLPQQKDMEGSRLTVSLSRVNKKTGMLPPVTPAIRQRVVAYCDQDIGTQSALHRRIGYLPDDERAVWEMDQRINDRGVRLDMPLVRSMRSVVDRATYPLAKEFTEITSGLQFTQIQKLGAWVRDQGVEIDDLAKETVSKLLGGSIDDEDDSLADDDAGPNASSATLPSGVRRALQIRQLVGSASIKKLHSMEACVCADGRAHGVLQYHAAGPGRWGGRIIQPQNFPRGTDSIIKTDIEGRLDVLRRGDLDEIEMLYGPPVETVVSSLRHTLISAPGAEFVVGDFAQIEARICLSIAGQFDKIKLFQTAGFDPYCDMASQIYGRTITKDDKSERQIGKNSVLGLGFAMGWLKFMMKYAPDQSEEFCRKVVDTYRKVWAPEVIKLWRGLERAALRAVRTGGPCEAYGIVYEMMDDWLTARLPSGRLLYYYKPTIFSKRCPWNDNEGNPVFQDAWKFLARKSGGWVTVHAFGGLLCENVCQAIARDLLVVAMKKCEANGMPLVLTVHDEAICEVPGHGDAKALEQIMVDIPDWARYIGVPVAAECWVGDRYRK